jgi:hypothetical protein
MGKLGRRGPLRQGFACPTLAFWSFVSSRLYDLKVALKRGGTLRLSALRNVLIQRADEVGHHITALVNAKQAQVWAERLKDPPLDPTSVDVMQEGLEPILRRAWTQARETGQRCIKKWLSEGLKGGAKPIHQWLKHGSKQEVEFLIDQGNVAQSPTEMLKVRELFWEKWWTPSSSQIDSLVYSMGQLRHEAAVEATGLIPI